MSKPAISAYHRPDTLKEAWDHIADGDPSVRLLSGGADLTIHAPKEVTTLVDTSRVLGRTIESGVDGTIHIGAMATLTDVLDHPDVSVHATGVIPEMMVHVGNPLLRNFSTIGGHLARGKLSDVVPVFLALDALVEFYDGDTSEMSLAGYYDHSHHNRPHILTRITLPPLPTASAAAFLRFAKTAFDFAFLNVCCRVDMDGDRVAKAMIVCGSTPMRAQRPSEAEAGLVGTGLTPDAIATAAAAARTEIETRSGWVASAAYRTHLVEVLTRRCLTSVAERLEEK